MRITLVISSMTCGGAERVMSILANAWAERGESVSLLTLHDGDESFYPLNPKIDFQPLTLTQASHSKLDAIRNNASRMLKLRRAISKTKPDVVISFTDRTNVLVLLAAAGVAPIIVSERVHPGSYDPGAVWSKLRRVTYPRASTLVVQTTEIAEWFEDYKMPIAIVPNPLVGFDDITRAKTTSGIVAAGRLTPQKGFDLLIEAFAKIAAQTDENLTIYGDGEERVRLSARVRAHGLADRISLPGTTDALHDVFAQSKLFVLSSRFEGFPNVLLEAMASGLPTVSFTCPSGPKDIVTDGTDGWLVEPENEVALAEVMLTALKSPDQMSVGERATEVRTKYAVDTILGRWDDVISGVQTRSLFAKVFR